MTKAEIIDYAKKENVNEVTLLEIVKSYIDALRTNWQVADVTIVEGMINAHTYTRSGYRKNTTGEYVPNSYRRNFGWKNTYYQNAKLKITVGREILH